LKRLRRFLRKNGGETLKKKVSMLNTGQRFSIAKREFTVIDYIDSGVLVIDNKCVRNAPFGVNNDFRTSAVKEYINRDYIRDLYHEGLPLDSLLRQTIDLGAVDGTNEYGKDTVEAGLITLSCYLRFVKCIPHTKDYSYWFATPRRTPKYHKSEKEITQDVWAVNTNNSLICSNSSKSHGVRPTLLLKPDIEVNAI
jgi:hypothetical protein